MHTLSFIDVMLSMASKKGKRESILAVGEWACLHVHILPSLSTYQRRKHYCFLLDTLKELWVSDLLPEERKLKSLKQVISSLDHVISDSPIMFAGLKKEWPLFSLCATATFEPACCQWPQCSSTSPCAVAMVLWGPAEEQVQSVHLYPPGMGVPVELYT